MEKGERERERASPFVPGQLVLTSPLFTLLILRLCRCIKANQASADVTYQRRGYGVSHGAASAAGGGCLVTCCGGELVPPHKLNLRREEAPPLPVDHRGALTQEVDSCDVCQLEINLQLPRATWLTERLTVLTRSGGSLMLFLR